jgi:hypothetical protein
MRTARLVLAAAVAVLTPSWLGAAERAVAIRAGELKQQPFIDAAGAGSVAANQAVSVVTRQGGWVRIESNGQSGWMRMLNVRLETRAPASGSTATSTSSTSTGSSASSARSLSRGNAPSSGSLLRTGSSGKTVTTGVKGLDESSIRGSTPDQAQVAQLETLAVDPAEAASHAASSGLQEQSVDYLKGAR